MSREQNRGLGNLFMTFLMIVIALALTPTVQSSVDDTVSNLTAFPAASTLCGLIPLFWVVIIIAIGIAAVYVQIKGW